MKRKLQFADWFWDKDFCTNSGFEALLKRLKDGRQMCKDVEDFLRQRAKIEEEYAKQLHKLAKSTFGNTESGTLRNSWDSVKRHTEAISEEHIEAHQALLEAANRVSEFADKQKVVKRQEEDTTKKSFKKKLDLYKRANETKKTYENKSKEADSTKEQTTAAKNAPNTLPKDLEKMVQKSRKAEQDAIKSDEVYKTAVDSLEAQRKIWEKDMVRTCEEFENLEETRINWLRNELWVHTNILSQLCVDNDNHCEEMRKTLERCDVDEDLMEYVDKNRTGRDRPDKVPYCPYQGNIYQRPPAPLPVTQK